MATTPADLQSRWPFFATAEDATLQAAIDSATLECDVEHHSTLFEEGVALLAAHKACLGPAGVKARLVDHTGRSVFLSEYERLLEKTGFSLLVGAGPCDVTTADLGLS